MSGDSAKTHVLRAFSIGSITGDAAVAALGLRSGNLLIAEMIDAGIPLPPHVDVLSSADNRLQYSLQRLPKYKAIREDVDLAQWAREAENIDSEASAFPATITWHQVKQDLRRLADAIKNDIEKNMAMGLEELITASLETHQTARPYCLSRAAKYFCEARDSLNDAPSMIVEINIQFVWVIGRRRPSVIYEKETGKAVPMECPFTLEEVLNGSVYELVERVLVQ